MRASSLNHHDLWSLRGVGLPPDRLPMILGCDAAGVDPDGNEVVVYPVVPTPATRAGFSLLSEHLPGTLAERVAVPPDEPGAQARRRCRSPTRPACRRPG